MRELSKNMQYLAKNITLEIISTSKCRVRIRGSKKAFQISKMRYRGNEKQTQKINMMFALANLYLADKKTKLA